MKKKKNQRISAHCSGANTHKIVAGVEDFVITAHNERVPISKRRKKEFEEWFAMK